MSIIVSPDTRPFSQLVRDIADGPAADVASQLKNLRRKTGLTLTPIIPAQKFARSEWLDLTMQGLTFSLAVKQAGVALDNSFAELANSAGSGINVLVHQVTAAGALSHQYFSKLGLAISGNGTAGVCLRGNGQQGNISPGVTAGLASLGTFAQVGAPGGSGMYWEDQSGGGAPVIHSVDDWFCVVPPGATLLVMGTGLNSDLFCSMEWAEVAINAYP
jgi:hypothetical protein